MDVSPVVLVHTPICSLTPQTVCIHICAQPHLQTLVPHVARCKHKLTCCCKI